MGVDCKAYLPPETRVSDAAKVIGLLAGREGSIQPLGTDGIHLVVDGVRTEPANIASCSFVVVEGLGHVLFHHEFESPGYDPDGGPAYVGIMPSSTPRWCGIAKGLVEFFGGIVDYNDCDDTDQDLEVERPRQWNNPCDGEPWDRFQLEMAAVEPADPLPEVAAYGGRRCNHPT